MSFKSILLVFVELSVILQTVHTDNTNFNFNLINIYNITLPPQPPQTYNESTITTDRQFDSPTTSTPDWCANYQLFDQRIGDITTNCSTNKHQHDNNFRQCGVRSIQGLSPRLTTLSETTKTFEFPWMIIIKLDYMDGGTPIFLTAGSLIHPAIVMTVAHRIHGQHKEHLWVNGGIWDLENDQQDGNFSKQRSVQQIIIHNQFKPRTLIFDIGLLVLQEPFEIMANLRTVCLPPPGQNFDNEECTVMGWGRSAPEGDFQAQLKKLDLPIVPSDECQNQLRQIAGAMKYTLHDSFLCAGGVLGEDACDGDGGSPLVCQISKTTSSYYQVGIVAAGRGCGTQIPGIYVNVGYLRDWIDRQVIRVGLNTSYYIV